MITLAALREQERSFALAFAAGDIDRARPLYHPEVVYVSPTVRLFDWPARIEGVDPAASTCWSRQTAATAENAGEFGQMSGYSRLMGKRSKQSAACHLVPSGLPP